MKTADITKWRNELTRPRDRGEGKPPKTIQKSSANRDLRTLKAALNFAFRNGYCLDDTAWRRVEPFKGAGATDRARTVYQTPAQRKRLLDASEPDCADLLRGLLYTAARPQSGAELPVARVADLDVAERKLTLRNYKGDGTERVRHVDLSDDAVAFFKRLAKDKLPGAYLFTRDGAPWLRHLWSDAITRAVKQANGDSTKPADRLPADTCAYTMRHCAITDRLRAGQNIGDVAQQAGTSVGMIEKHYAKYISDPDLRAKLNSIVAF